MPHPPRKRGRQSHVNREVVIQTALRLLAENPNRSVTMAEIASALGIVTMGLYKHVRNKDDLLAGMAEVLYADLDLTVDPDKSIDARFYQWTGKFRDFFLRRPYAHSLMAWDGQISSPLMGWTADLVLMLQAFGVPPEKMARTVTWLFREITAYVLFESTEKTGSQKAIANFDFSALSSERQDALKPILPEIMSYTSDDLYRMHIEVVLAALKRVAAD